MRAKDIRTWRNRTPFKPFIIELTSGTRLAVRHPENLVVGKFMAALRRPDDELELFTPQEVCALLPLKNGAGRNGR